MCKVTVDHEIEMRLCSVERLINYLPGWPGGRREGDSVPRSKTTTTLFQNPAVF